MHTLHTMPQQIDKKDVEEENMRFRPCIDIHNGQVKQIVGGSLKDKGDFAVENFVSGQDAAFYAEYYKRLGLKGGHIILLNSKDSDYYEATQEQALKALKAYPQGLQIGGGINDENATEYIEAGASHVIVTSFVFKNGHIHYDNLHKLVKAVGKEKLVLDVSCRKKDGMYYIVTDRWQKFTDVVLSRKVLTELQQYCDEFLIHAVDVEGKASGIETELTVLLSEMDHAFPVTYAGGVGSFEDLRELYECGKGKLDVTIGSALDLFGGSMPFEKVLEYIDKVSEN